MERREQPLVREVQTVLSVNEGGWRRGRGESDGNAASGEQTAPIDAG